MQLLQVLLPIQFVKIKPLLLQTHQMLEFRLYLTNVTTFIILDGVLIIILLR